jgi:hypothetical protein
MGTRSIVRIVGFICMPHHSIGEGSVGRSSGERSGNDACAAFSTVRADVFLRGLAWQQLRSGDHRGECINKMMLGVLRGFRRQRAQSRSSHIIAQSPHDRTDDGRLGCTQRGNRQSRNRHCCRTKNIPTVHRCHATPGRGPSL